MHRTSVTAMLACVLLLVACPNGSDESTTPRPRLPSEQDPPPGGGDPAVPTGLGMRTRVWKKDPVVVPTSQAPWKGGRTAKVTILEFSEFECPWCKVGARIMDKVLAHYGSKVKLVFHHSPIPGMHPQSPMAAEATLCAQAQGKFWAMHDILFLNQGKLSRADLLKYARRIGLDVARFTRELDSHKYRPRVQADKKLGRKKGVEALPTFFVNGQKVEGAVKFHIMKRYIDVELAP